MSAHSLSFEDAEKALKVKLIENGKYTQAVHDVVVALRASRRAGTHSVKTKATVAKSGSKPWRQKGTGRARAGYASSPIWRGGGVVFGPHPRDYTKTVPRRVRQIALKKALSERAKAGDILTAAAIPTASHKTKELVGWIGGLKLKGKGTILLVDAAPHANVLRASRNVPGVEIARADLVTVEQLLRPDNIFITAPALEVLAGRLATTKAQA